VPPPQPGKRAADRFVWSHVKASGRAQEEATADKAPKWSIDPIALASSSPARVWDPGQEIDPARVRDMLERSFAKKGEATAKLVSDTCFMSFGWVK